MRTKESMVRLICAFSAQTEEAQAAARAITLYDHGDEPAPKSNLPQVSDVMRMFSGTRG